MAVCCEGDSKEMERLGEKQDFESELSRLGFTHEAFKLHVRRANATVSDSNWSSRYAVCVTNTITKRQNIYWGGPGKRWISDFSVDVSSGIYGPPEMSRVAAQPSSVWLRPRLVVGGAKRQ